MFEMRSLYPHFSIYKACIHLRSPNFDLFLLFYHYLIKWMAAIIVIEQRPYLPPAKNVKGMRAQNIRF